MYKFMNEYTCGIFAGVMWSYSFILPFYTLAGFFFITFIWRSLLAEYHILKQYFIMLGTNICMIAIIISVGILFFSCDFGKSVCTLLFSKCCPRVSQRSYFCTTVLLEF